MKRKLIKIGNSTLLLSIPREWVIANNLAKGDEIEVQQDQDKLTVWCDSRINKEKAVFDITDYGESTERFIYSVYRSGIDQVELRWTQPSVTERIKSVVWKDAVGFEVLDQGKDHYLISNLSGKIDDFQQMVRRLFLITVTMGEETASALKTNKGIKNILYMEQENNRLTTLMIRALNKYGPFGFKKTGPIYYIIQELEKIGDQYKFLAQYFLKDKKFSVKNPVMRVFEDSISLFRKIYELFYDYSPANADRIRDFRKLIVERAINLYSEKLSREEIAILHHSLNIITHSFDMLNSIMILKI